MGLDMFLHKIKNEGKPFLKTLSDLYEINYTERSKKIQNVCYWRKANQIHKWFVDNIQNGMDDCEDYQVSKKQIITLLNICKQVKLEFDKATKTEGKVKNGQRLINGEWEDMFEDGYVYVGLNTTAINELLPPDKGPFFGSTDIDQWYLFDIENTISQLEKVVNEIDFENYYVCYSSSW